MEPTEFRKLMAGFPAPVTVVTTSLDRKPFGATVSSFASLSLEPPLISIALIEDSALARIIDQSRTFAVNLLAHRQTDVAMTFASRVDNRFANTSWVWEEGLPRVVGAASFMICDLHQGVQGGDHRMMFGHVRSCHITDQPPLVYTAREFGTHSRLISDRAPSINDIIAAYAA
jgi:flavin reductase (DIM6/NTAB) family NADH-FMN oxidoreductase RutF